MAGDRAALDGSADDLGGSHDDCFFVWMSGAGCSSAQQLRHSPWNVTAHSRALHRLNWLTSPRRFNRSIKYSTPRLLSPSVDSSPRLVAQGSAAMVARATRSLSERFGMATIAAGTWMCKSGQGISTPAYAQPFCPTSRRSQARHDMLGPRCIRSESGNSPGVEIHNGGIIRHLVYIVLTKQRGAVQI